MGLHQGTGVGLAHERKARHDYILGGLAKQAVTLRTQAKGPEVLVRSGGRERSLHPD